MTRTDEAPGPPVTTPISLRLLDLLMGSWRAGVLSAFAELGVADVLRAGKLTPTQLACRMGLERDTFDRFCRAAAGVGLLRRDDGGTLELTDLGVALATDSPASMRNFARWSGSSADRCTWAHLATAVRAGRSPFAAVHGTDVWDFFHGNPDTGVVFEAAMGELSRQVIHPVVDALDLTRCASITDVGGGRGALLSSMLVKNPYLKGVLFDQPDVVARAPQVFAEAGVQDRVSIAGGSFFDTVPSGSDLYMLSNVLHDWDDAHTRAILANVSAAMTPGDDLAIIEAVVGVDERFAEAIGLMDMDMLVLCDGKQRSVEEFSVLLSELGIEVTGVSRAGLQSIIRAQKVD